MWRLGHPLVLSALTLAVLPFALTALGSTRGQASLRPEQAGDAPFVYRLFAQTRAVQVAQLPLDPAQREAARRELSRL